MDLKENSLLGLAFYNSIKAMVTPISRTEAGISSDAYVYLDSKELRHYLQIFESVNHSSKSKKLP